MSAVETVIRTRRAAANGLRAFYSRPIGWAALIATSLSLSYIGGGVMFWFHAIYRGEEGPAINNLWHWFFDSSLGFAALTPALFFILPGALWALDRAHIRGAALKAAGYVLLVGVLFGVATGPGPILHNALVGRDAALGKLAVNVFGFDPGVAASHADLVTHSEASEAILQVLVGVPVYIVTGLLALGAVRALARKRA